ncbi:MAG: Coenzyme F420 hydrogenase/dehydrogenase, beta subunit C-terminal domain [Ruminococcus sp.]|nr:Coenzyme F420 hydrogenase/dehydrogenase, beta subunit C-terminal domain [Ruminococcus sp.]
MISIEEKSHCSGCHACANACPKNCIQMISDEEGFWYPQVDKEKCIDCGLCEKVCPIIHKWQPDDSRTTTAMAAINLNEEIRFKSSSGGIFTLIAEEIINQGGVVFGAAFADDFKSVHHICVDNTDDLEKLRGSKYVQSKIGDTYKQAKHFLDSGRKVLFTGTPCQIGGLYSYLRKPYENLFTQDIICHGVPSPMVWEKYVDEREKKAASKTQRMFFRHKKYGWKTFAVLFEFSNNTAYIKNLREDSFMRAFLSNSCLRPSCYDCSFKSVKRQADITLADFWGIQNVLPEMDDDKGTSLVLLHTSQGKELIYFLKDKYRYKNVNTEVITKYNPAGVVSCKLNKNRNRFLKCIKNSEFDKTVSKYTKDSLYRKTRSFIGRLMRDIRK